MSQTVRDSRAILGFLDDPTFRWGPDNGATVVITYSFSAPFDGRSGYWGDLDLGRFDATQRANTRKAMDQIEKAAGVVFHEVKGAAMMNFGAVTNFPDRITGQADSPVYQAGTDTPTAIKIKDGVPTGPGTAGFLLLLHEIGHSLGLSHPHEGTFTLASALDTVANTVMTYNTGRGGIGARDLGRFDKDALQTLYGDAAAEVGVTGSAKGITITGTSGGDDLIGTSHKTVIRGGKGADELLGRAASDRLFGGSGKDTLDGGAGRDTLFGGAGDDTLRLGWDTLAYGGAGSDTYQGRGPGLAEVYGGRGADRLKDGGGLSTLYGDGGKDRLSGGGGEDQLFGGGGHDRLQGGGGDDLIDGGGKNDRMTGGKGADVFVFTKGHDRITDFQQGLDRLDLSRPEVDGLGADELIARFGEVVDGDLVLTFSRRDTLTLDEIITLTNADIAG